MHGPTCIFWANLTLFSGQFNALQLCEPLPAATAAAATAGQWSTADGTAGGRDGKNLVYELVCFEFLVGENIVDTLCP